MCTCCCTHTGSPSERNVCTTSGTPPMAVSVSGIGSGSISMSSGDSVGEDLRIFFTYPFYRRTRRVQKNSSAFSRPLAPAKPAYRPSPVHRSLDQLLAKLPYRRIGGKAKNLALQPHSCDNTPDLSAGAIGTKRSILPGGNGPQDALGRDHNRFTGLLFHVAGAGGRSESRGNGY